MPQKTGFALLDKEAHRKLSSEGGKAVHAKKRAAKQAAIMSTPLAQAVAKMEPPKNTIEETTITYEENGYSITVTKKIEKDPSGKELATSIAKSMVPLDTTETRITQMAKATENLKCERIKSPPAPKAPTPPAPPKPQLLNHIIFLLDESGSMGVYRKGAMESFNRLLQTVKEQEASSGQQSIISLYTFNNSVYPKHSQRVCTDVTNLTEFSYQPRGGTALIDAIGQSLDDAKKFAKADEHTTSFLVFLITDGEECSSHLYTAPSSYSATGQWGGQWDKVKQMIAERNDTNRWSFVLSVPEQKYKERLAANLAIPLDNIQVWEKSETGIRHATEQNTSGTVQYFNARSAGATKTDTFYHTADLSKVSSADLSKLEDVSPFFKSWVIEKAVDRLPDGTVKELEIGDFVTSKTHLPYVFGSAYYQLTKKETVQPNKVILIAEKGKKEIYGGKRARQLLGLDKYTGNVRLTPGNMSNYDVWIQSTTANRKLVRGTRVLWDKTHRTDLPPTWDHTVVQKTVQKAS